MAHPVKLYNHSVAPNPRRVRIFAAEKGIQLALEVLAGQSRTPEFLAKNPSGAVAKYSLSAFGTHAQRAFSASSRGPRKEIAQLQQSFALLAVIGNFLNFIAICFFRAD